MEGHPVARWHEILARRDPRELQSWLDEEAVFVSVHERMRSMLQAR